MFPNFIPKQEQQQIPIWRYSSNAAQIQLARPPKLTYFEVENLLSKTDEDNYVPAIFVRSCNGIRGYGGGGNSINYKIPTELVWLGKFDCPEIIEEGFFCTRNLLPYCNGSPEWPKEVYGMKGNYYWRLCNICFWYAINKIMFSLCFAPCNITETRIHRDIFQLSFADIHIFFERSYVSAWKLNRD